MALVAAAQAVEHYEIARYGTPKTRAKQLGLTWAIRLFDATLQEEVATDQKLSDVAKAALNAKAAYQDGAAFDASDAVTATGVSRNRLPRAPVAIAIVPAPSAAKQQSRSMTSQFDIIRDLGVQPSFDVAHEANRRCPFLKSNLFHSRFGQQLTACATQQLLDNWEELT